MQTTRPIPNCLQKTFREDCLCSSLNCASSFGAISNWSGCYLLSAGPLPTEVVEDHEAAEDQLVSLDVSAVPLFAVASTPGSRYCTRSSGLSRDALRQRRSWPIVPGVAPWGAQARFELCRLSPVCSTCTHTHLFVGESARPDRCLIPTDITHDPVPFPNSQKHDRDRAPRALSGCRPQASERCDEDAL